MLIADPNLDQRTDWLLENGTNVNPIPADQFVGTHLDDGTFRIVNVSSRKWGGALLTNKRQVPFITDSTMSNVTYVGLDMLFWIDPGDFSWLWAHETDLKIVVKSAPNASTKIPNVYDFSGQVNMSTGGMVQIDKDGKWTDTGIKLPPKPGAWNLLQWRYKMDVAGSTFSVLSINEHEVDPSLQNQPLLVSNWGKVSAVQLQNEVGKPGSLGIKYRGVHLLYSPEPIPLGQISIQPTIADMDAWGAAPDGGGPNVGPVNDWGS